MEPFNEGLLVFFLRLRVVADVWIEAYLNDSEVSRGLSRASGVTHRFSVGFVGQRNPWGSLCTDESVSAEIASHVSRWVIRLHAVL